MAGIYAGKAIPGADTIINAVAELLTSQYGEYYKKGRALELLIVNRTSKNLKWKGSFFAHGSYKVDPEPLHILAGGTSIGIVTSNSFWKPWVAGGFCYDIEDTDCFLHVGFTNPWAGSYKHYITVTRDEESPKHGYNLALDDDPKSKTAHGFQVTATKKEPVNEPAPLCANKLFIFIISDEKRGLGEINATIKQVRKEAATNAEKIGTDEDIFEDDNTQARDNKRNERKNTEKIRAVEDIFQDDNTRARENKGNKRKHTDKFETDEDIIICQDADIKDRDNKENGRNLIRCCCCCYCYPNNRVGPAV